MFKSIGVVSSLSNSIEQQIENAIRKGKLVSGQKIPTEESLCKQFSVSRTAIREAIGKLTARGLLYVKKGSGTYVSEISFDQAHKELNLFFELSTCPDLIGDTIEARRVVEPEIAALAAQIRSKQDLIKLETSLKKMIACDVKNIKREAELDNEFHSLIIASTNNNVLRLLLSPVYTLMPKYREQIFAKDPLSGKVKEKKQLIDFHTQIYHAIRDKDPEKARSKMSDHLKQTILNYRRLTD